MNTVKTADLHTKAYNKLKEFKNKPLAIKRIPFEIRRKKFVLELIVNVEDARKIDNYGPDMVWTLSDIFLSHFENSKHIAPDRNKLAESRLFASSIRHSDLVAVVKRDERPLAFGTFDFHFRDHVILSKATFSDHSLERRFGVGNLLNILISVIAAEYLWIVNPSVPFMLLGRTQHPLQVAFTGRHCDRILCSTSAHLGEEERETFRRLAGLCYPYDSYDEETGIACGVYQGPGAPPPAPEVRGFYEKEFACLNKDDALYFIGEWEVRSSTVFQKSANFLNKIFGTEMLYIGLFLSAAADHK